MKRKKMSRNLFLKSVILVLKPNIEREIDFFPHKMWNDLRIEYQIYKGEQVDYNLLYSCKCSEEEMHEAAVKNTKKLMPVVFQTLPGVIESRVNIDEDDAYKGTENVWVIYNEEKEYGANNILFPENLEYIGKRIGNNFYILPCSIHEVLCISVSGITANAAVDMVREVNKTEVKENDFLSDNIYLYNRKTKKIKVIE